MTIDEMLDVLAEREPGEFWMDEGGNIRHTETELCPICEAARLMTGETIDNEDFSIAARRIGLDQGSAREFMWIADGFVSDDDEAFRQKIIDKICGKGVENE